MDTDKIFKLLQKVAQSSRHTDTCAECGCITAVGVNRCWECIDE